MCLCPILAMDARARTLEHAWQSRLARMRLPSMLRWVDVHHECQQRSVPLSVFEQQSSGSGR